MTPRGGAHHPGGWLPWTVAWLSGRRARRAPLPTSPGQVRGHATEHPADLLSMSVIPPKLQPGSHLRVIAPSRSLAIINADVRATAERRLGGLGVTVSFGRHTEERDAFASSSAASRLDDLHEAFDDAAVDGVLTAIGGFNSNQILPGVDWALLRRNPKPLCGFSDITALQNAILARSGLVTYSGPHYSTFAIKRGLNATLHAFTACLFSDTPFPLTAADSWTDDPWSVAAAEARLEPNEGWWIIQEGTATGMAVGGNLRTFSLLNGTPYQPDLAGTILLAEADDSEQSHDIGRSLVAMTQQPGFDGVQGLLAGRFQRGSGMSRELLRQMVATEPTLAGLPVIANVDFGHTYPMVTLPIGGALTMTADLSGSSQVTVIRH